MFVLAALGAALPVAAVAQTSVTIAETAPVVTLNVTETVEAAPDMATVGTGVQTRAQTAAQAMRDHAVQMDKLIAALVKAGIPKKDKIGRAACRERGCRPCRPGWSPDHSKN